MRRPLCFRHFGPPTLRATNSEHDSRLRPLSGEHRTSGEPQEALRAVQVAENRIGLLSCEPSGGIQLRLAAVQVETFSSIPALVHLPPVLRRTHAS